MKAEIEYTLKGTKHINEIWFPAVNPIPKPGAVVNKFHRKMQLKKEVDKWVDDDLRRRQRTTYVRYLHPEDYQVTRVVFSEEVEHRKWLNSGTVTYDDFSKMKTPDVLKKIKDEDKLEQLDFWI